MSNSEKLPGKVITAAFSSLTNFSCEFADGTGLILEATENPGPELSANLVSAQQLPRETDAVCKVDWGWIIGSNIKAANITAKAAQFNLDGAGPLTVSVQVWQGKPFLAFQPYRPA